MTKKEMKKLILKWTSAKLDKLNYKQLRQLILRNELWLKHLLLPVLRWALLYLLLTQDIAIVTTDLIDLLWCGRHGVSPGATVHVNPKFALATTAYTNLGLIKLFVVTNAQRKTYLDYSRCRGTSR